MKKIIRIVFSTLLTSIFLVSCAGKPEVGITEDTVYERPMPKIEYEYELGPGDVVEIVYHYTPKPDTSEYYLAVGDVFKVEFAFHPEINRQLIVRPDGNIAMPRKGDVSVLGLTPSQIQDKLTDIYSTEFLDPVITITMVQYNRAIERLKRAITTAARGQSKLTAVRPDGYITFPMLSDIMARGRTMPELRSLANKEYDKLIDNITVTLILKVMKANLVYIMGQVQVPNYYLMEGPHTVSQLISRAGGARDTAELSTILVISRDEKRRPWGRIVNLEKIIHDGDMSQDIVINQYDVIYVPRSTIAKRNLFVQQYINNMIPSNLLEPYFLGGTLIQNEPLIK